jgi:prevent-host-death family protein
MKTVNATEFKAKCLALLDEVQSTGEPLQITKRGKPVAQVVPFRQRRKSIYGFMKGQIKIHGDIISPLNEPWDAQTE